jgi:NAD(P)-dependent dehydrogenase (short-subunit alcohol dehydrogenase family)
MNLNFDFSMQTVVITGAAGNLGQDIVHAFHQAGGRLALLNLSKGKLARIFPEIAQSPDHLLIEGLDVTDAQGVQTTIHQIVDHFGKIDILVNTVGGYQAGKPLHETDYETWDFMLNLNARSVFTMCHEVLPYMIERERGKIINVAAAPALKGSANSSAYSVAKTAVARLTESMAAEYKNLNINVNAILPSAIDTPQNRAAMPKADFSKWVTPEAIARVILFLASEAADPINGALLPVFGRR